MSDPAPPFHPASIQLASTLAETGRMHDWLDGIFTAASIPEQLAHAIRLCLEEAVMNVILHGYGAGRPGAIEVSLWPAPNSVIARVSDTAAPFDPTQAPLPPKPASLASAPVGGRGLGLIRRYADACRYQRQDGRNHLTLEFAR